MDHIAALVQPGAVARAAPARVVLPADDAPAETVAAPPVAARSERLERVWVADDGAAPAAVWRTVPAGGEGCASGSPSASDTAG